MVREKDSFILTYFLGIISVLFASIGLGKVLAGIVSIFSLSNTSIDTLTIQIATMSSGFYFLIPSLILGIVGLRKNNSKGTTSKKVKGINSFGIILSTILIIISIILVIILTYKMSSITGGLV